jgi:hypothetical protein
VRSTTPCRRTWLRLSRSDTSAVGNLGGWLTTVLARVCLDMLRSRKSRREEPMGPHIPEPVVDDAHGRNAEMADSVAEFVAKFLCQRLDDAFRINAAARPDLVDQRITVDRRARKVRGVREFALLSDHGDADVVKACRDQKLLDRIDLVAGDGTL